MMYNPALLNVSQNIAQRIAWETSTVVHHDTITHRHNMHYMLVSWSHLYFSFFDFSLLDRHSAWKLFIYDHHVCNCWVIEKQNNWTGWWSLLKVEILNFCVRDMLVAWKKIIRPIHAMTYSCRFPLLFFFLFVLLLLLLLLLLCVCVERKEIFQL